ncbi:MAG: KpsF/GutQ family sugar-phosphate isomerase [Acidobacteria bacterium]|nr:KpsF/GutQ family sugar-phosphate isomerase [Acidobacteriota bacterium]
MAVRKTKRRTAAGQSGQPSRAGHSAPSGQPRPSNPSSSVLDTARKVLETEARAVAALVERLDSSFERAVEVLSGISGRVIVTGMGKSGLVAKKIAATFSSTGTPSFFLHPAEAIHGDLGMMVRGDAVVALSYSGETEELIRLLERVKRLGIPLISMTGNPESTLARASDVLLDVSIEKEACLLNLAPTASTTASLAMGDALAVVMLEKKGFQEEDFAELHPAGALGRKLKRVEHLMHEGEAVPVVRPEDLMSKAVEEMSRKGFGMTMVVKDRVVKDRVVKNRVVKDGVVEDGQKLVGVISDGDLRRLLRSKENLMTAATAGECMMRNPLTIGRRELAARALNLMESRKITFLPVVDEQGCLEGLLHLHDLWTTQMF